MKKLSVVLAAVLMLAVMPAAASASNYGFKNGDYVDLNGYVFRVLDSANDYLIYSDNLENRAFDFGNSTYFSLTNTNNVGYYLNTTFKQNLGSFTEHLLDINWGGGIGKIGLISKDEYHNLYRSNINSGGDGFSWWTRTHYYWPFGGTHNIYHIYSYGGTGFSSNAKVSRGVRPTLYLKDSLFKERGDGSSNYPFLMSTKQPNYVADIQDFILLNTTYNSIHIKWKNPVQTTFSHLKIYLDDVLVEDNYIGNEFIFENLTKTTDYKIKIYVIDNEGYYSNGKEMIVSTNDIPIVPDVQNLKATTKHDRINLSWRNPQSEFFHHVKIYRRVDEQYSEPTAIKQNSIQAIFLGKTVSAEEPEGDFDPMFETNGTYWNDLTVKPSTTYSYKLTTENIAGAESEGVVVQATTLAEPPPTMGGEEIEKDENGDFKLTWTSPTTGQVKILVDGNEYAIVDASLQEYVIPADDMVYDLFGKPKVQLIAIDEDGKEGNPSKPPVNNGGSGGSVGVNLPDTFNVNAFLKTVMSLIAWVGPFILLALAIRLAPRIVKLIKDVIARYREGRLRL